METLNREASFLQTVLRLYAGLHFLSGPRNVLAESDALFACKRSLNFLSLVYLQAAARQNGNSLDGHMTVNFKWKVVCSSDALASSRLTVRTFWIVAVFQRKVSLNVWVPLLNFFWLLTQCGFQCGLHCDSHVVSWVRSFRSLLNVLILNYRMISKWNLMKV